MGPKQKTTTPGYRTTDSNDNGITQYLSEVENKFFTHGCNLIMYTGLSSFCWDVIIPIIF